MQRRNCGLIAALIALSASFTFAQQAPSAMDRVNLERGRQMLHDAYDEVKKHYYDPKFHGIDIDARFKQHDAEIAHATSLGQSFSIVASFLDGLNDSHTFFRPPPRPFRLDYGFRIQMIGNTPFVIRVRPGTDAESKVHPGDEVLAWNGFKLDRKDLWKINYLFNSIAPQNVSKLSLRDPSGQTRDVEVQPSRQQEKRVLDITGNGDGDIWQLLREEENSDHAVRQRYDESEGALIWKMPEFDLNDDGVDHMFALARKHPALILDLRGNPGGLILTLERMLGSLFDHDVKIADRMGRKELKPQIAKTRAASAFTGRLYVLVDSNSASCSELFARVIQLEKRGVVLGDASEGAVMEARGYAESQGTDTKIFYSFSVTDADLIMKDGKSLEHSGVVPDEMVVPTALDLAEGRDPALARAAQLAGVRLNAAIAGRMFPFEWLKF